MDISQVATVRIHPAIGIARVGDSDSEYFIGPELPGVPPAPHDGKFKDSSLRIKRQAARFRCFGYNQAGTESIELTHSDQVGIEWTVGVANRKAATTTSSTRAR